VSTPQDDAAAAGSSRGLYIQMVSIHGLIRGRDLELGRDADTGGQTKYVVELACALGDRPEVDRVDLFTRRIDDPRVSDDYDRETERLTDHARIVRLGCGGGRYRRKERLWPHLDAYVAEVLRFNQREGLRPDLVHGHYADAGYVAAELARYLDLPLVFTGHSLGRNKLRVLTAQGIDPDDLEERYHLRHRIEVEERLLREADVVIASTRHEVERGYERYEAAPEARFEVIAPGIDVDRFYPYYWDGDEHFDPGEGVRRARARMREEIERFLNKPDKPLILAVSRPDRRKNIEGLVTAYGADEELRSLANLAIFAGVRRDIREMSDNEREVLTELLLLMDRYDLYGKLALPKKHDPDTDIPVLYRLAAASGGVFVNPALVENFGITLIEASSSGLPVVSTDHGGPQDIIGACGSGVLIDASDTGEIQRALKHVIVDRAAWQRYSRGGVDGVRRHYAWTTHAEHYLETVAPLLERSRAGARSERRRSLAERLQGARALLVSDIDHTLVEEHGEGDPEALERLGEVLTRGQIGFGVASGRSLELVEEVLAKHPLPPVDVVISSVGSEIHYPLRRGDRVEWLPDGGYAEHLRHAWDRDAVERLLADEELEPQPAGEQREFKLSYCFDDPRVVDAVRTRIARDGLKATVIASHGRYLDVLPVRASKGRAVRFLTHKWSLEPDRVAVAGDSGNDEEMLRGPYRGIVVANHDPEIAHLEGRRGIHFARGRLGRGVLEGLEHWGFVEGVS
jgi:sucrose-phosphate synthase